MAREPLQEASKILRSVSDSVEDERISDRLVQQAEQLETLATRERGPDHGRLDRHQHALKDIDVDADNAEVAGAIKQANERIVAYRETVEGV